jgi:hypothetical protein
VEDDRDFGCADGEYFLVRISGALFFLYGNISRGVTIETLSPFIFSSALKTLLASNNSKTLPGEVIANSSLTDRWVEKETEEFSRVLRYFGNLKEVYGVLWYGVFDGLMDEGGRTSVRESWGTEVNRLRLKLVKYKEEEDENYVVPEIKLI